MKKSLDKIKIILTNPQSVATGTLSIIFFTVISKGLGFLREIVLAASFGTSWRLDALIVAMDPALQLGTIFAGGVATMMVPIFLEIKSENKPEKLKEYTSQILFISSSLVIILGIILIIFPNTLIQLFAPRFTEREMVYAIQKMRITGFLPLIRGLNSIAAAILNAEKKYTLTSIIQLIYNILAIPLILIFAPLIQETSYLVSFIIGMSFMDTAFLFAIRRHISFKYFNFKNLKKTWRTILLAFPLFFSGSLSIINHIVDKAFASSLEPGSISALRYGNTLKTMITSVIVSSLMTTVFTEISENTAIKNNQGLQFRLKKTSNDLFNLLIPLTVWLIVMAEPTIKLLFERGAFTADSTQMVTKSLIGYSLIIIITPINNLMIRTFIAFKKTFVTFIMASIGIIMNYVLNSLLIEQYGVMGIAISSSIVILINTILLYLLLAHSFKLRFLDFKRILKITLISILPALSLLLFDTTKAMPFFWLLIINLIYFTIIVAFNRPIIFRILQRIRRKN